MKDSEADASSARGNGDIQATSSRRAIAAQVVAWHNRHPLARRINRRQVGGFGVVSLPFSPPAAEGEASGGQRFPMFDDLSLIPGLSRNKVTALALAHGWDERPGASAWPLRNVPVGRGWNKQRAQPIYLLTVALKRGARKPPLRLLIGQGAARKDPTGVIGHRLLSRPRMGLGVLMLAVPIIAFTWGLTLTWSAWRARSGSATMAASNVPGSVAMKDSRSPVAGPATELPGKTIGPAPWASGNGLSPVPAAAGAGTNDGGGIPVPRSQGHADRGPLVGTGIPTGGGPSTRAAAPASYRLVGEPQRDSAVLKRQATELQAVLASMGHTGGRVRLDVVGTPDGDALTVGPIGDQGEAERISKRLAAKGIVLKLVEQP